ncbi:MAG: zinc ribbon domain-containing protein [Bacilli bacterium]|nr:zinc ribbon domain-containing protein [Bacilli bacterium]
MYCPKCNASIPDDSNICPYCGYPIRTVYPAENESEKKEVVYVSAPSHDYHAIAILALVFGILGGVLGLIFAIIGLVNSDDESDRNMCKIGLGAFIFWVVAYLVIVFIRIGVAA